MDGSRFDAWTRRRFGLVMGGGVASLLGLVIGDGAEAKHGKGKHKKRCKKLKQGCQPSNKHKKCCKKQDLICGEILGLGGKHCCRKVQGECSDASDCCGDFICDQANGKDAEKTFCCGAAERDCGGNDDCCIGFSCFNGKCAPI